MHKRTIYQAATKLIATALIVMLVLNIMPVQPAYAADTGLRSPTGNVNGTGGNGWTNPQNAYTSNNVRATAGNGDFVNYINFGFDGLIPSTDVIDGIEILIEGSTSGRDATVDLSWNNGGGYTTGDPTANFTGTEQIITVGGSADTWGRTWLPNEFNNASFRVRLTATGGGGTLSVDHVQARVYHHALVSYTINASAGGGGTITPSGAISAAGGSNQTFDIVPSATYIVSGVSIDGGASTGRVNHYTFTNVQANRTIAASFDGGWSAPSASANNNGVGNPNNVFSSNDTYADIASTNDLVNYRNFGLAIPNGATIDGIEVAIEGYSTGTRNADVALSWNNGTSITAPFKTTTMPTTTAASEATAILGGAADTWGRTWSSADFANGSFAVRVEGTSGGGSTLYIDQLQVKVYYQLPDNTPPTTTAAPVGGTYNATQNVTLTCDDGAGSGCASTYYCTGAACTPITLYSGAVAISSSTDLRFYSSDNASNDESVKTESYIIDTTAPTVTITSAATNPTGTSPIPMTFTFSKPVNGFVLGDITVGNGVAGNFAGLGDTYTADITPTTDGLVTVDVGASVAQDGAGNDNTAATQFSVTYDTAVPQVATNGVSTVPDTGDGILSEGETSTVGFTQFLVTFSKEMDDTVTGDEITNADNYLLLSEGSVAGFQTVSCAAAKTGAGVDPGDTRVAINSVTYDNSTFTATLNLAGALPNGIYRLYACGTATLRDLAGNALGGGVDFIRNFQVQLPTTGGGGGGGGNGGNAGAGLAGQIPVTGFAPGRVTDLRGLPVTNYYAANGVTLEVPVLKLNLPIVGVPMKNKTWDVNWLLNQAGWLEGTAFPGYSGNSVLTSHVTLSYGQAGPFTNLHKLAVGDKIFVHAFGDLLIYEVKSVKKLDTTDPTILRHEDKSWLTLVTCADYNETAGTYLKRLVVKAVLIQTQVDN